MNLINKNNYLAITACIGIAMLLSSCSFSHPASGEEPDQLTLFCENLKQDIILNDGLSSMRDNGPSPTKAASYYKQYDQNNCDDVIAGKRKSVKLTS